MNIERKKRKERLNNMDLYALWLLGSAPSINPNIVVEASLSYPCKPQEHVHGLSSIAVDDS